MTHSTSKKKRPYRPARPRQLPDVANLPPLVRIADCWTNRSQGKYGLTPYSRGQLEDRIRRLNIRVRRLSPRNNCLTKEDVIALQRGELV